VTTVPSNDGVDALRERLRALGYLDARVDRFVLGGAVTRGQGLSLALTASARIGVLAGLLLGPAAVVGLTTRVPGLVTSVMDALVLAAYLSMPFGVASALLAVLAIIVAGRLARRGASDPAFASHARRAAITAGLVVAAACLLYLTLWWHAAVPPGAWAVQLLALAVAAAIAVLIGHAVTVSVLAYLVRLGLSGLPAGSPLSSWRVVVPVGLMAVVGAMVLLRALAPAATATAATAAPPLVVVPTGVHAVVIGIDGVDVGTLTRLRAEGRVPTFDRLMGTATVPLVTDTDRDPAQVWTTLGTGQPVERHGIRALAGRQLAGVEGRVGADAPGLSLLTTATDLVRLTRPTITSGSERRVPTFWEVGAAAGLRTAVIHWWATWPASDSQGTVLSDRAILRLEQGGDLSAEIAPASLYPLLLASAQTRTAGVETLVASIAPDASPEVAAVIDRSATLDATVLALATDPALGAQDLLTLYLPGLDIAQHALFPATGTDTLAPAAAAERVRALEHYYVFLDRALAATLMDDDAASRMMVLVTQPGRVTSAADGAAALVAVSGSGATLAPDVTPLSAEALAPTILRALGVPVADDLAASSVESIFTADFRQRFPLRSVATYGERRAPSTPTTGQPLDREMIERMRSLGYVR